MRKILALAPAFAVLLAVTAGAQASASSTGGTPGATVAAASGEVTLVTGEQVRLATGRDGRPVVSIDRSTRSGVAGSSTTVEMAGDLYVIPLTARPYLGRFLDVRLFDVSALARAGASARLPVQLTYSGAGAPSLPGVTLTSASSGVARGYLTPSSARAFGAALVRQYVLDAARGWAGDSALFAGVGQLTADIAPAGGVVPAYPMRTLIIKVLDSAGAPVPFTELQLLSVDDARKFSGFAFVVNGQARVSVPLGTYAGLVEIDSFDPFGITGTVSMVAFDSYVVSSNNQTLTLDARTATSTLSVGVPGKADTASETWEWDRTDGTGFGASAASIGVPAGIDIRTTPVHAPATSLGTLNSVASWALDGTPPSGLPYTYDLAFPSSGVPANQAHRVRAGDLATVTARYFSDSATHQGAFGRSTVLPFQFFSGGELLPLDIPERRVEYVLPLAGGSWESLLLPDPNSTVDPFAGAIADAPRLAKAGASTTIDWARNPLAPGVPFATDGYPTGSFLCPVCRTGDTLQVFLLPVTDTTPGHEGELSPSADGTPVTRFRLYRNGVLVADLPDSIGVAFPVTAGTATYKVIDEIDRRPGGAAQSLTTRTELTFRSSAASGKAMPGPWVCALGPACTVPPLLQAAVLLPVNLNGAVPIGTSTIALTLGHIQGAQTTAVTGATIQVRIGTGQWTTLPGTALGGGRFHFVLTTTASQAGDPVDLRVDGTDDVGGQIIQTTTGAFIVAKETP